MWEKGDVFMKLDTQTLIFMLSLALFTQVIAIFVQFKIGNRTYRGVGWWLLGSGLMSLGVILMPMVNIESLNILARISNPLLVLGQIFLYIAIIRFFDKKENLPILSSSYIVFILFYYYYMYFNDDISSRTVIVNGALAAISFLASYELFAEKNKLVSSSAYFTASAFLIYGGLLIVRIFWTISAPPAQSYDDFAFFLRAGFIVSTVTSTLWTFGFILMANQRLNTETLLEKEKMQLVFNTSPDAALITRLSDGVLIDVNVGFTVLFGYTRDEVLGVSTMEINFWHNNEDRQAFLLELNAQKMCENIEFNFLRKDGSQFLGMISATIIDIQEIPHFVSVIRNITKRKLAELQIQELVKQLEIEKNTAQLNSITDSLTGLSNRRYFDLALKTEFHRLKRSGATLSLIIFDIDHFKKFNDYYGHLSGDDCLRRIGILLKTIAVRSSDVIARYGGEEFAVILPETESFGAKVMAERIRKGIESLGIPHYTSDVAECITVSLGVVSVSTTGLVSQEQVVALADEALYCAKNNGRNRVEVKTAPV